MLEVNEYHAIRHARIRKRDKILSNLKIFYEKKIITKNYKQISSRPKSLPALPSDRTALPLSRNSSRFPHKGPDKDSFSVSKKVKKRKHLCNIYGTIEGVSVGDTYNTRIECFYAGVHRIHMAGIHPGKEGAYSVAISGNYEDDQDDGYSFIYTGSGGRDFTGTIENKKNRRIAPQTKNQTVNNANKSLIKSIQTRNPVRVIRGYKLDSPFAPYSGYRYDGLYTVEKYWTSIGRAGFLVYKFFMKRCENQLPPSWEKNFKNNENAVPSGYEYKSENAFNKKENKKLNLIFTRKSQERKKPINKVNKENNVISLEENLNNIALSTQGNMHQSRICKRKFPYFEHHSTKRRSTLLDEINVNSLMSQPSFDFNTNLRTLKWLLFASEEELNNFGNISKNKNRLSSYDDFIDSKEDENFKGFNQKNVSHKMILLGFLLHDLQNE